MDSFLVGFLCGVVIGVAFGIAFCFFNPEKILHTWLARNIELDIRESELDEREKLLDDPEFYYKKEIYEDENNSN